MDSTKYMVIAKGKIETDRIISCEMNSKTRRYDVRYRSGQVYSYSPENITILENPKILDPANYQIYTKEGKLIYHAKCIYEFDHRGMLYWHIPIDKGSIDSLKKDLQIVENVLLEKRSSNVFDYLKELAALSSIDGKQILSKYYETIGFVGNDTALSKYLNPSTKISHQEKKNVIFPFGCNQSQYKAVRNALENQISVIQGPPGTGKTQTILNIIANLLLDQKSIIIVSNNNSATLNVLEKLAKPEYGLDFLVAPLGNADNKKAFIEKQTGTYPDLSSWKLSPEDRIYPLEITKIAEQMQHVYQMKEDLAESREALYAVEIEKKHFDEYQKESLNTHRNVSFRKKIRSGQIMHLIQELQMRADRDKKISKWLRFKSWLAYGISDQQFWESGLQEMIRALQNDYYDHSILEFKERIEQLIAEIEANEGDYDKQLEDKSLRFLKNIIAERYPFKKGRQVFEEADLLHHGKQIVTEYPIVLSTTYSARTSLNPDFVYDYVIMDEASQVDISTAALALSCAKNAVIVGDLKQLPNVVDAETKQSAEVIRTRYALDDAYDYVKKNFLASIVEIMPNIPSVLLREHYRCDPRIISFCNQKFYDNELVIMTEGSESDKAISVVKSAKGNHARGAYSQRQIDIIKQEILPNIDAKPEQIGIIAPYNAQVDEIKKQIPEIDAATVHKFQGREKDVIILSTVDDQIRDFTDDPYLLNVAVSRAKKQLVVVISGNEQGKEGNIVDLVSYIQYNKMDVIDSNIHSVFDYLYGQYREARWDYLRSHRRVSEYDSETLVFHMLQEVLQNHPEYAVACFEPLSMVVKKTDGLSQEELKYLYRPGTHLDFLIFNKFSKQPILAVEADGYSFHKQGTIQHERDQLKDHILENCGLKLVRLTTNGSGEFEKVSRALEEELGGRGALPVPEHTA